MTEATDAFTGFPRQAVTFLAELGRQNRRPWFEAHRTTYESAIVTPALRFVTALGTALQAVAPTVQAEPRIGGSLFRIHRDARFSRDKSPYKTHVGMRLRDRDTATSSRCTGPLFYVEIDAAELRLGVGVKEFDARTLAAYQQAVCRPRGAAAFEAALQRARQCNHNVLGPVLARAPRAYAEHGDNPLLRWKGFFVREDAPHPAELHGPDLVPYCVAWFSPYAPLFEALRRIALAASA